MRTAQPLCKASQRHRPGRDWRRPGVRNGITSDSLANRSDWPVAFLLSGVGLTDGQDWPFRMARRQRSPSAVGDQVECFEDQLADQDLASRRSDDGLGPRGEVSDLDRHVGHGPFFAPLVCVDDGSRSPVLEPQLRCDLLGDDETHRPGVDHAFHHRSSDVRLGAQPEPHGSAVVPVLQRHAGSNLSHPHGPPILTHADLRVHRVFVALVSISCCWQSALFPPSGPLVGSVQPPVGFILDRLYLPFRSSRPFPVGSIVVSDTWH